MCITWTANLQKENHVANLTFSAPRLPSFIYFTRGPALALLIVGLLTLLDVIIFYYG